MMLACMLLLAVLGDILTVDDDGPAEFSSIQAAIDAAATGDAIVVEPGTYDGFVLSKRVSILGRVGLGAVRTTGVIQVQSAPAFRIAGLEAPTLNVWNVPGPGVIDGCTIGAWTSSFQNPSLLVMSCNQLVIGRSLVRGRSGGNSQQNGWPAAVVDSARVSFVDCRIYGGAGGLGSDSAPSGAAALVTTGAPLTLDAELPAGAGLDGTTLFLQTVFPGLPGTLDPGKLFVGNADVLLIRS